MGKEARRKAKWYALYCAAGVFRDLQIINAIQCYNLYTRYLHKD